MATTKAGMIRYNAAKHCQQMFDGLNWVDMNVTNHPYISNNTVPVPPSGHFSINKEPVTNTLRVTSKIGTIEADLDTGALTLPVSMSRNEGLREFWLAFQDHFKGGNTDKYEKEIKKLENEIIGYRMERNNLEKYTKEQIKERLRDKVEKTYGSQKFIMMKPDDLLKFLEIDT